MSNNEIQYNAFVQHSKEKAAVFNPELGKPFLYSVVGITNPTYKMKREVAEMNVFEYVLEGEGEIYLDGKWVQVRQGDVYVLEAGQYHEYRANPKNPWKKIWINYVADYMHGFLSAYSVRQGVYRDVGGVLPYFERLLSYVKPGTAFSDICYDIAACVHKIIELIAMSSGNNNQSEHHRIREVLNAAVYKTTDLNLISEELHISKSNLIRVFKKAFGITPYEYLLSRKIEAAKLLLVNTNMSIKQISSKICMSDEHYFSSLFMKRTGFRPKDYRNNQRMGIKK